MSYVLFNVIILKLVCNNFMYKISRNKKVNYKEYIRLMNLKLAY